MLTVYQGTTVVGTATVNQDDYASWKVSSRTWNPTIQTFSEVDSTGDLAGQPLAVDGLSTCAGGCTVTSNKNYVLTVPVAPAVAQRDVGVDSAGTATVTGKLTTQWIYAAIGLGFPPVSMTTVGVRCDSQPGYKYPAGCANPSFTPTYILSSATYPDIAKVRQGPARQAPVLVNAHPGVPSAGRREPQGGLPGIPSAEAI